MATETLWWSESLGRIELQFTQEQVDSIPQTGEAHDSCELLKEDESIASQFEAISDETLRESLREYGAWSEYDLLDREQNIIRILWLACLDVREEQYAKSTKH